MSKVVPVSKDEHQQAKVPTQCRPTYDRVNTNFEANWREGRNE